MKNLTNNGTFSKNGWDKTTGELKKQLNQ